MAIAFDAATTTSGACSINTYNRAHTCGASANLLIAIVGNHTAHGTISGVTYNGVAMTKAREQDDGSVRKGIWYLYAPSTGSSYNITATCTVSTGCISIGAMSFSGAQQSGIPDSGSDVAPTTTTSFSQSTTTIANNCFVVWAIRAASGNTLTGGTNTTVTSQGLDGIYGLSMAYSTAAITPAGSTTLNVTSSSQLFSGTMISFAPAGGAAANGNFLQFM